MLTELELVYWTLINHNLGIIVNAKSPLDRFQESLMMTAMYLKKYTCAEKEVQVFETFFNHNQRQFMINYERWMKTIAIEVDRVFNLFKINEVFR